MESKKGSFFHELSDGYPSFYIWLVLQKNIFRSITSPFRLLPNFIIFGSSRSGTRSLTKYLNQHPSIKMASRKEVHFFNKTDNFNQGPNWYKSFFPTTTTKKLFESKKNTKLICGEATPDYIYNPKVPERILKLIPKIKLIAVLRNPIDRAYSHYHHMVRSNREELSFEDAIRIEPERIASDIKNNKFDGKNYFHYSYLRRGIYHSQLKTWMNVFDKNQFLILESKQLENNLEKTLDAVFKFLGIPKFEILDAGKINVGNYPDMKPKTRKFLEEYFKPHNEELEKFLNQKFSWT